MEGYCTRIAFLVTIIIRCFNPALCSTKENCQNSGKFKYCTSFWICEDLRTPSLTWRWPRWTNCHNLGFHSSVTRVSRRAQRYNHDLRTPDNEFSTFHPQTTCKHKWTTTKPVVFKHSGWYLTWCLPSWTVFVGTLVDALFMYSPAIPECIANWCNPKKCHSNTEMLGYPTGLVMMINGRY